MQVLTQWLRPHQAECDKVLVTPCPDRPGVNPTAHEGELDGVITGCGQERSGSVSALNEVGGNAHVSGEPAPASSSKRTEPPSTCQASECRHVAPPCPLQLQSLQRTQLVSSLTVQTENSRRRNPETCATKDEGMHLQLR